MKSSVTANSKDDNPNAVSKQANDHKDSPQSVQPSVSNVNPITQAAVSAGILNCVSRINQVVTYLTAHSQSGAFLFFPKIAPDQSIFSTSIEVQCENAPPIYASASFAPLTSGQVGAVYDVVQYLPRSCDDAEKSVFKGLKRVGVIKKNIVVLDAGAARVFLMPAGPGCIVIKKEVVQ